MDDDDDGVEESKHEDSGSDEKILNDFEVYEKCIEQLEQHDSGNKDA